MRFIIFSLTCLRILLVLGLKFVVLVFSSHAVVLWGLATGERSHFESRDDVR
jgi:hypothetical protein